MDAILLAGGVPAPDSALYPYTQGEPKATLMIGDNFMIQWVLDALNQADTIEGIIVVGCEEMQEELTSHKIIGFKPDRNDIILNFSQGADAILEHNPKAESVVVVSSDIPMLTPESVNWVINSSLVSVKDIHYCVIDQTQMEQRVPESARSYVKLRDKNVCGGDLSIINLNLYADRKDFWRKIFQARKSYLHQASLIGFDILIMLLLRRLTFDDVVEKVTRRLDITGQGLICPYPEIGMDVDKPHQLELARRVLS
jgi:GTP:adenosylcobinamide-phosphate guanylyltransferase